MTLARIPSSKSSGIKITVFLVYSLIISKALSPEVFFQSRRYYRTAWVSKEIRTVIDYLTSYELNKIVNSLSHVPSCKQSIKTKILGSVKEVWFTLDNPFCSQERGAVTVIPRQLAAGMHSLYLSTYICILHAYTYRTSLESHFKRLQELSEI